MFCDYINRPLLFLLSNLRLNHLVIPRKLQAGSHMSQKHAFALSSSSVLLPSLSIVRFESNMVHNKLQRGSRQELPSSVAFVACSRRKCLHFVTTYHGIRPSQQYVVVPGNNSRAVLAAFRRRPWWGPARKENDGSAAVVVRSSFFSRRKKGGKSTARDGPGSRFGYRCVLHA